MHRNRTIMAATSADIFLRSTSSLASCQALFGWRSWMMLLISSVVARLSRVPQ